MPRKARAERLRGCRGPGGGPSRPWFSGLGRNVMWDGTLYGAASGGRTPSSLLRWRFRRGCARPRRTCSPLSSSGTPATPTSATAGRGQLLRSPAADLVTVGLIRSFLRSDEQVHRHPDRVAGVKPAARTNPASLCSRRTLSVSAGLFQAVHQLTAEKQIADRRPVARACRCHRRITHQDIGQRHADRPDIPLGPFSRDSRTTPSSLRSAE